MLNVGTLADVRNINFSGALVTTLKSKQPVDPGISGQPQLARLSAS
jgi:hypothetical protein